MDSPNCVLPTNFRRCLFCCSLNLAGKYFYFLVLFSVDRGVFDWPRDQAGGHRGVPHFSISC